MSSLTSPDANPAAPNSTRRVLLASLAGTTIEFFDYYIYATAAVLVFPQKFFPASSEAAATLQSFSTFALAFFARPIGSAVFGHFGDRIGRKATLVAALLTMGLSTVFIGLIPSYASIGVFAPLLLAIFRFGQGFGLGGEWGGAVLLATENAPPGKRAWFGMFPQLGAPIGFIGAGGCFLLINKLLSKEQFFDFGWRLPFLASSILILFGLYVRLKITETPAFRKAIANQERVEVPFADVFRFHARSLILGTFLAVSTFVIFYLLTVFCLQWGTKTLHYKSDQFLLIQLVAVLFFAFTIPYSAYLADRYGRRITMLLVTLGIIAYGFVFAPMMNSGFFGVQSCMIVGFALTGMTYGPLGTLLSELFPTKVRYTGSSLAFNLAGILGASLAPRIAVKLAADYGLPGVGYYLSAASFLSLLALWFSRETREPLAVTAKTV